MHVSFTKVDDRRYHVAIEREHGPALIPRFGPGYDDLMPHDLAHYLVEEEFEIELGVWGQLAAGSGGIFRPAPGDDNGRFRRTEQRIAAVGRGDMLRSERLTALTVAHWERAIGRRKHQWRDLTGQIEIDADRLSSAVSRLDEQARRWSALQYGRALTYAWPPCLVVDLSKTHRGRRSADRVAAAHPSPAATRH